jgi:hypothetical protein
MLKTADSTRLVAAAGDLVRRELPDASDNTRQSLVTAVTNLLIEAVNHERERAVGVCRKRADLWRKTPSANGPAAIREEARARANEAAYLADLLDAGEELPGFVT